jgi:hypothetical protein
MGKSHAKAQRREELVIAKHEVGPLRGLLLASG